MVNSRWAFTPREVYATDLVLNPNGEGWPLAHLLHTSGTPLAHPWHASRAPLAAAPDCRRRRIPRPPKETTTSHSQRKKITSRGKRFPPHTNLVLPLLAGPEAPEH